MTTYITQGLTASFLASARRAMDSRHRVSIEADTFVMDAGERQRPGLLIKGN